MLKKIKLLLIMFLVIFIGFGAVKSEAHMMKMKKNKMMKMFFLHHSLGLMPIFYQYHPGPMWILKNAKALHLSASQISQEKILKKEMFMGAKKGVVTLRKAIKEYKMVAETENPSINEATMAVRNVGTAKMHLANVMISYNIKAYNLLNANQMVKFKKLAKANWKKMALKMKIMHKMMMIRTIMKLCHMKLKMLRIKMMMLSGRNKMSHKKHGKMY